VYYSTQELKNITALTSGHGSGSFRFGSSAWRLNQYAAATAPATVRRMGILHVGPSQAICLQAEGKEKMFLGDIADPMSLLHVAHALHSVSRGLQALCA
jgi:hypothetical protein